MIGLTGTRVIIVDDDEGEALPILKAFAKMGIPAAFFDGSLRGLPQTSHRLSGVRLAILDMDLAGGGTSDKAKVSALVKVLERILSPENGPYIVLAWTKHPELVELFENQVFLVSSIPRPIFTVILTKAECKNTKGYFDPTLLSTKLEGALDQFSPLLFLQAWEGRCFAAATAVTNELSRLTAFEAADLEQWRKLWKVRLLELMYAMAAAEAEQRLDGNSCLKAFYVSLNPLHSDRMESNVIKLSDSFATKSTEILAASNDCGIERKARVNTMLHLAFEDLENFFAGNLYKFPTKEKRKWVYNNQLIDDLIQTEKDEKKRLEIKEKVYNTSTEVLVEASAACDHAQNNIRMARFIAGLVVPADERKRMKQRAGFIWELGPVFLDRVVPIPGQYYFYFSARHVVTLDLRQTAKLKAFARLRGQAFTDLQAWFAHHAARPGVLLLRDRR